MMRQSKSLSQGKGAAPVDTARTQRRIPMNYIATAALMLSFGAAAGYAQQLRANMTLSGTAANSTVDLGTGAPASEYNLAGSGALGLFTLRLVSAGPPAPQ